MDQKSFEFLKLKASAELELRRRYGGTFRGFVEKVRPSFVWYRHCDELAKVLDRVCSGEIRRLMVFEPRRHGKSELVSRLFPAYYLYKHPTHHVGIASYGSELAGGLSRDAREYYRASGRQFGTSEAESEWHTHAGGRCWSAGVGGPIIGKGGELLIFDDPFKNREDAYSQSQRDKVWDWSQSTWETSAHPGAIHINVMTRWHPDDYAGRLLELEKTAEYPEKWHIVCFEALKEETPPKFPESCTLIPDWRQPGEALNPDRYDVEALLRIKSKSSAVWLSMYQQRPTEESGNIWKREWFKGNLFDDSDLIENGGTVSISNRGFDWDTAYTENEANSATAFIESGVGSDGNIYICDLDFMWYEFPETLQWMKEKVGPHYVEQKASGKSIVQALNKMLIYAAEVPVKGGDKVARTTLVTPLVESGRVKIHRRVIDKLLDDDRQGILKFKSSDDPYTDLNDVFVQALNRLWPFTKREPVTLPPPKDMAEYIHRHVFQKKINQSLKPKVVADTI